MSQVVPGPAQFHPESRRRWGRLAQWLGFAALVSGAVAGWILVASGNHDLGAVAYSGLAVAALSALLSLAGIVCAVVGLVAHDVRDSASGLVISLVGAFPLFALVYIAWGIGQALR